MKIVRAIYWENFTFSLMWTTVNFEGRSKVKKWAGDICKSTLNNKFEQDLPVGLGAMLSDS